MEIIYTIHARQRMIKRNVTEQEVEDTLSDPDDVELGDNGGDIAIRRYGWREVHVVFREVEPDTYLVFTVIKLRVRE